MKLNIVKENVKCDIPGCTNLAKYAIILNEKDSTAIYICKECLMELGKIVNQNLIPKGIENIVKKNSKKVVNSDD